VRKLVLLGLLGGIPLALLLAGCGGSSGSVVTPASASSSSGGGGGGGGGGQGLNTVTMTVDSGPAALAASGTSDVNTPFITVTVCAPGSTSNCQQIDHVEVDTMSYGLRIVSSVLAPSLAAALRQEVTTDGNSVVECAQFADGFSWGPVKVADMQVGGESASNVPIQVIGDPAYELSSGSGSTAVAEIPTTCSSIGPEEDTVATFGANGIIGVGVFAADCGSACRTSPTGTQNPADYYECPPSSWSPGNPCVEIAISNSAQVTNPVDYFQTDNNGVIVQLPAAAEGASTITGTLTFGIGTESNNSLGSQTVLTGNAYGDVTTTYTTRDGQQEILPFSYFDTGSNAYYFSDSGIPSDTSCSPYSGYSSSNPQPWFCPGSELNLSALNMGQNGTQSSVAFSIGNAYTILTASTGSVFYDLGASSGALPTDCTSQSTTDQTCSFDFGLPFFLGRTVYVAYAGAPTAWGNGPWWAY
jgi:hypothetical protein